MIHNNNKNEKNIKPWSVVEGYSKSLNFFDESFYIHGEFDQTISTDIVPAMVKEIEKKKNQKDARIKFYINSHGGYAMYVKELIGHIDVAKSHGIIIETYVFGNAYSCGSILAVSGTKDYRYVGEHAEHLCHLGQAGSYSINDIELERNNLRTKAHFDFVRSIYRKNCTIKDLNKVIKDDCLFIRGNEIIKMGLADKIL